MTGSQISHYEVEEKLGAGGMGEVWKARDTVLRRSVALKVLPAGSASTDPKRRLRMLEEARAAGSLNHTNIAALYDIVQESTRDILVMEYVAGRQLDDFIGGKPLKTRQAIELATQIADGLAAAHRQGLTHRDLKPSNLIVTKENVVKVLDFGLAKRAELPSVAESDVTMTAALTDQGQVVGTPAYMSPEQAEGLTVDPRSDIFSFGLVLYEMLSGKSAFRRATRTATLNAVVHEDPAPIEGLPRTLQRLLAACLEKDPGRRLQNMADARHFLEAATDTSATITTSGIAPALPRQRKFPLALAAGLLIGAAAAWFLIPRGAAPRAFTPIRITIDGQSHDPALSPDGKLVAYSSERAAAGNRDIWVQDVETGSAIRLTSEQTNEGNPVFSADGAQIYFSSNRKPAGVYRMARLGGEAQLVIPEVNVVEPSPDGKWLAYVFRGGKLFVRPSAGGQPKLVYEEENLNPVMRWYTDSRHLILNGAAVDRPYAIIDTQTGALVPTPLRDLLRQRGFEGNTRPIGFLDDDTFLTSIIHRGVRRAVAIDWSPRRPSSVGAIRFLTASNESDFGGRATAGRVTLASGSERMPLWTIPGDINAARQTGEPARFTNTEFATYASIDRRHSLLAYTTETANWDQAWVEDLATRKRRPVVATNVHQYMNILNAQGTKILFSSYAPKPRFFLASLSGGEPAVLCEDCRNPRGWTTDEKFVLHIEVFQTRSALMVLDVETKTRTRILDHPEGGLLLPVLSPDDRDVLFILNKPGAARTLYVAPFHGKTPVPSSQWVQIPVPHSLINSPFWSPDGRWIYYIAGEIDQPDSLLLGAHRWDSTARKPLGEEVRFYKFSRSLRPFMTGSPYTIAAAPDRIFLTMDEMRRDIWLLDPAAK